MTDTGSGMIKIAWESPDSDGGSPITQYVIETRPSGSGNYSRAGTVDDKTFSYDIAG